MLDIVYWKFQRKSYPILFLVILLFPQLGYGLDITEAKKLYILGDTYGSISVCKEIIKRNPSAEAYYLLGLNYMRINAFSRSRDYFRKVIKKFSKSTYYYPSFVKLGDVFFLDGNLKKAEKIYKYILEREQNITYEPHIYLRLAQIYSKKGAWQQKDRYVGFILRKYPNSVEAKFARILKERGDYFFIQVGSFVDKKNAQGLMREIKELFPNVYIDNEMRDKKIIYRVRVGKFFSRKEAENVYNILVKKGYPAIIYP